MTLEELLALERVLEKWLALARDPGTLQEVLAELARDGDWEVRMEVAMNPATPSEVLAVLAGDGDWIVRRRVAVNSLTPQQVLAQLAGERNKDVRQAAVRGWLRQVLARSGAAALYEALGEDPLEWDEARQRQLLRELGEDA